MLAENLEEAAALVDEYAPEHPLSFRLRTPSTRRSYSQCGGDFPWRAFLRGVGRLFGRPQPHHANRRHGADSPLHLA